MTQEELDKMFPNLKEDMMMDESIASVELSKDFEEIDDFINQYFVNIAKYGFVSLEFEKDNNKWIAVGQKDGDNLYCITEGKTPKIACSLLLKELKGLDLRK